jgi:hypothetical protein
MAAPREAHARLFVNEEYVGVYLIVEAIDRSFVTRVFGAEEGASDLGGFLYKYEKIRNYQFEYLGPELAPYAEMFEPKTRENDSAAVLYGPLEDLVRVVNETPEDQFLSATSPRIDLAQAMRFLAVEDFMAEVDGFVGAWTMNNFYLYRSGENGVAQLLPWDAGQTFSSLTHPIDFNLNTNGLTVRAIAVPELRQIYMDTLAQCAAIAQEPDPTDPRGWLEREVVFQTRLIDPAVALDPVFPHTLGDFHVAVEGIRKFAEKRSGFVMCELGKTADPAHASTDCAALIDPPPVDPAPEEPAP